MTLKYAKQESGMENDSSPPQAMEQVVRNYSNLLRNNEKIFKMTVNYVKPRLQVETRPATTTKYLCPKRR